MEYLRQVLRSGQADNFFICANVGCFAAWAGGDFHWFGEIISPYHFLPIFLIGGLLFTVYSYLLLPLYNSKMWTQYVGSEIDDPVSFTQRIAVPLHHSFISLLLASNLLALYESLNLSLDLASLVGQLTLIILVGSPIALYIYITDKNFEKHIEEDYNDTFEEDDNDVIEIQAVSRKLDENITEGVNTGELVLANGDNDELKQFIISTLKEPEFSRERYHQNYAAFVIAEGETTVFNKEELEDMFEFQDELGIDLNSIDIGTFKLLNRTDTEYCTSVIFEYDYDLKLIGSMGLKGKVVNHSIMLWTENGWLFLADTQEI